MPNRRKIFLMNILLKFCVNSIYILNGFHLCVCVAVYLIAWRLLRTYDIWILYADFDAFSVGDNSIEHNGSALC